VGLKKRFGGNIKGDIFGGLTAGIVALPLALGFGVASGIGSLDPAGEFGLHLNGASIGMFGAIIVGLMAALFGGTATQVSGPTGPMTVIIAGVVGASTGDPRWVFMAIALAGVFQILLGVLKIGKYINYIPYPVISGFMSGIGVIIIILQFAQLLGHDYEKSPVAAVMALPAQLSDINVAAVVITLGTVALIYLTPRITKAIPGTLVGLVVMTVVAVLWEPKGLLVIGEIPRELPKLSLPSWEFDKFRSIIVPAAMLAIVGSLDSLLTSLVADALTKDRHNGVLELVGQGIGNAAAGLFGGLPGAGATMRTVVNVKSGGRTHLSGVVHSLLLVLILAVLGPLAAKIPMAVLAGILLTVGIGIIDVKGLKHLPKVPRGDAAVMVVVLFLTVFVDLMWAVGIGMVMASLILVKRLSDMDPATHSALLDVASHIPGMPALGDAPSELLDGVYLLNIHGSLFFGNAGPLQRKAEGIVGAQEVIVDFSDVRYLDQSGAYALREITEELQTRGARVWICGLHEEPRDMLLKLEIAPGLVPAQRVFHTLIETIQASGLKHGATADQVKTATKKLSKANLAAAQSAEQEPWDRPEAEDGPETPDKTEES
jgi:sulfate permease, SulP family